MLGRQARLTIGVAGVLLVIASAGPAAATLPTWRVDERLPLDTGYPPQEYSPGDTFLDVEAVGPHDAWAVGVNGAQIGAWGSPVLRHWHDGTWLTPTMPSWLDGSVPGGWVNSLQAVGGSSPNDVWAFGTDYLVTEELTRAIHWNGTSWTRFSIPVRSQTPRITSVVSFGTSGAWAFGCYCGAAQSPFIGRFSNGRWTQVSTSGLPFGGIWTASAISASDIWAVMSDANQQSFTVLQWNGSKWATVAVPSSLTSGTDQFVPGGGLVASSTGGVWFAGYLANGGGAAVVHELNGKWTLTKVAANGALASLISDGNGGLWSATQGIGTSAQVWHYASGQWALAPDPSGVVGSYHITWMAHIPSTQTELAIGNDTKNELLLSSP